MPDGLLQNALVQGGPTQGGVPPLQSPMVSDISLVPEETVMEPTVDTETLRDEEKEFELNVQYDLPEEERARIAEHIVKLVDEVEMERSEWKEIRTESLDLLNGVRPPKSDPWRNCSNITTMATATHCRLMHAKLLPTVWNENLVNWRPVEKTDVDNVEKVKKFMRWVVHQDLKLQNVVDDIVWDIIINGTVAAKVRWVTDYRTVSTKDEDNKLKYEEIAYQHCEVENVSIDEVYIPSLWKGVDKSEFIAQNIYNRLPELEDLVNRGIYRGEDLLTKLEPTLDERACGSLDLKKREIEGTQFSAIQAKKESLPVRLIECYLKWLVPDPVTGKKKMTESVFTVAYESKAYLSGKPLSAVSFIGKRPWVIGQFIRRTGRPYGISLPELMRGLAKELDAIHNQRIDAGTITISPFGFFRAASSFRPEKVQIGPGTMIPVDDIKDVNVVQLQNNPIASFQEERIITEYIEKLTSTSAYQMGRESDIAKSRATATGTMAIIGQGEQAYTILGLRCQELITNLLTQILQQYQMWMPAGYAEKVLNEDSGQILFPGGLDRDRISGQYDAYMTLDAVVGNKSTERQSNAALVQMGPQLMVLAQDPRGYEMAKDFIQSLGKIDVEKYLGPKPQKPPTGMPPVGPGLNMGGGQEMGGMTGNLGNTGGGGGQNV